MYKLRTITYQGTGHVITYAKYSGVNGVSFFVGDAEGFSERLEKFEDRASAVERLWELVKKYKVY